MPSGLHEIKFYKSKPDSNRPARLESIKTINIITSLAVTLKKKKGEAAPYYLNIVIIIYYY